jgi:hypothetical protein
MESPHITRDPMGSVTMYIASPLEVMPLGYGESEFASLTMSRGEILPDWLSAVRLAASIVYLGYLVCLAVAS